MFVIKCPWDGEEREQVEFTCHGEAHIVRPTDPDSLTDEEWGDYVFFRKNPKGIHYERWVHNPTRRWFNVIRNTVTDKIYATYMPGDPIPELPAEAFEGPKK